MKEMPTPQLPTELGKFPRNGNLPSTFIPTPSTYTEPLQEVYSTKDVEYTWNTIYQEVFDKLKSLVCTDTTFPYFDVKKPVTIQVNTSKTGPRATLLQDDFPVVFSLQDTYSNETALC